MIFRISNVEEFKFVGDKSSTSQDLISAITARKMLRNRVSGILGISQGYHSQKDINLKCSSGM